MAEDNKEDNKEESTPKKANISKEILGNKVSIQGEEVDGSLSGIKSTIAGPNDTFVIEATVSQNEGGYQISGKGNYLNGPFEGEVSGIIQTDENFVPDESSLDVSGQVKVSKELSGILIELTGTMENGSLAGLTGTVQGPNGAYFINATVENDGDGYIISGEGVYASGPIQGAIQAKIKSDKSFNIDPASLDIGGEVNFEKQFSNIKLNLSGAMENGSLSSISGTIEGPNGSFLINVSVVENGAGYTVTGSELFWQVQ